MSTLNNVQDHKDNELNFSDKKVDEAWKSTVDQEKAKAVKDKPLAETIPAFANLVSSLGYQALIHLGEMENPMTNQKEKNPAGAKETIDLIVALKDKTKGNLSAEEEQLITKLLADLQLRYVEQVN